MNNSTESSMATPDFGAFVPSEHHIELYSGGYLDLAAPDAAALRFEDVAHGLANTCRFAGQCDVFYSVAEHAVLVSNYLLATGAGARVAMAGLHHDDPEAFIGDVTRPLKALLPGYRDLERAVWEAVGSALDLGDLPLDDPAVKEADDWALSAEAYHLLGSKGHTWFCAGQYAPDTSPVQIQRLGLSPSEARAEFVARHHVLAERAPW